MVWEDLDVATATVNSMRKKGTLLSLFHLTVTAK